MNSCVDAPAARVRLAIALAAAMLLTGCNSTGQTVVATAAPPPATSYATQPYTPKDFRMPEGAGCTGDVARWKAIQDNDYASGNIGLPVYNQIKSEIAAAAQACAAGRDQEASVMVAASRRRHGYPG